MSKNDISPPADESSGPRSKFTSAGNLTPVQLTALTALAIFVGETLIMLFIPFFDKIPVAYAALLDSALLTLFAAPILTFLLFRPMVLHIEERKRAESALRTLNETLEKRVAERTEELTQSNKALKKEVQERRATEERLRRTNDFVQRLIESAPCLMATIDPTTLKCNYVNGRVEDFLGHSPDDIAASGGTLLDMILDPTSSGRCRTIIREMIDAPQGEIFREKLEFKNAEGGILTFRVGIVAASRTPIGEVDEVLFVATPIDTCG